MSNTNWENPCPKKSLFFHPQHTILNDDDKVYVVEDDVPANTQYDFDDDADENDDDDFDDENDNDVEARDVRGRALSSGAGRGENKNPRGEVGRGEGENPWGGAGVISEKKIVKRCTHSQIKSFSHSFLL